jgi:hypothetical protein
VLKTDRAAILEQRQQMQTELESVLFELQLQSQWLQEMDESVRQPGVLGEIS